MKDRRIKYGTSFVETESPEKAKQFALGASIAKRVYGLLAEKGMNQKEFAHALGKSETEVSRWLSGTHNITLATIAKMSIVLGDDIIAPTTASRSTFKYTITSQPQLMAAESTHIEYGEGKNHMYQDSENEKN